jgi:hypothetical protein
MSPSKWARVTGSEAHGLRRGAWYPVVHNGASSTVVLDVNKSNRPVNRTNLEFSDHRPEVWSVVQRDPGERAARRADDAELGALYGVCPKCNGRATLEPSLVRLACPSCSLEFEIDWANPC